MNIINSRTQPIIAEQKGNMIQIEEAVLRQLILHRVGNEEDKLVLGDQVSEYTGEEEMNACKKLLLKPFVNHSATFEFRHELGVDYNILFKLVKALFAEEDFVESSQQIARLLSSVSRHPNIKEGDLFIAKFDGLRVGTEVYEALGIYKFEEKEVYMETNRVKIDFKKGIGSKKPDKACLVIFTGEPYTLLVIDNNSGDTDYWQNEFIKHKPKNDFVNNTNDFLHLTKNFITEQMPQEFRFNKTDQIDLLNRSVGYFKTHDQFDKNGFEEEVLHHDVIIQSFRKFDETYKKEQGVELADNFQISTQAVKKQARVFKSVLKLDKNFHVYIHGNRELIEQGVDENGRKFYKIYYEQES